MINLNSKYFYFPTLLLIAIISSDSECSKKDILDYTDAEIEKLYHQWEENDEDGPLLDENDRKTLDNPSMGLDKLREKAHIPRELKYEKQLLQANSPDELLKLSKKGQSVMMFVSIKNPNENLTTKQFTERIASLWQVNFYNNHIDVQNFVVDDDRILFLFKEGSQAWDARDFILKQLECKEILLEGKTIRPEMEILKDEL